MPAHELNNIGVPGDHDRSGAIPSYTNQQGFGHADGSRTVAAHTPSRQSDPGRPASGQYDPGIADHRHAPDIPVPDPASYARQTAEYAAGHHHDDPAHGWPDDSHYAPPANGAEQDQYQDEPYAGAEDYDTDEGPAASGLDALRRKLRPWHAIAAVAALAVASIGWSFLHRAGMSGSREIATIEAPEGPMKVKPAIEPETDAPTAGAAAVLDRNEPEPVKKVVKNLEQAVDPSVAPPQEAAAGADAAPPAEMPGTVQLGAGRVDAPHEPPPVGGPQQPRRVKSIAVPAAPVPSPTATAPAAPPPVIAPTTAKPSTGATYAAQFPATNSEAEARALIKTLAGKYGGSPGGGKLTFKPVKTGGKTVYRVRMGGLTQEAADALCARAKTGGDSCAVVGN